MLNIWFYSLVSVFLVSLISLIGLAAFSIRIEILKKILLYMVSFSAGGLFGDAFIHLLPEAFEKLGFSLEISIFLIFGIFFSFILEKFIRWRHCHIPTTEEHPHPFAFMNLFGDALHNFIDGLIIGASYLASIPVGIATTLAVIMHEIPQEIGDFSVLVYGGFSRIKALFFNFLTALSSFLGAISALLLGTYINNVIHLLISFAGGTFIYIAGSDLIPEMHKEVELRASIIQLVMFLLGIGVMFSLLILSQ
jgi:zinc and cadmium transporter